MKKLLILLLLALPLVGCEALKKVTDGGKSSPPPQHVHQFFTVACCRIPNSSIYPPGIPEAHQASCHEIEASPDGQFNGDTYLAMHVDCGRGLYSIGDQYYAN